MTRQVRVVLVVDGQQQNRELCATRLKAGGYEVITARDAIEALHVAELERPDVVVCALNLKAPGGFAFCVRLQSESSLANVPVVLITDEEASHEHRLAAMVGAFALVRRSPTGSVELDAVRSSLREVG